MKNFLTFFFCILILFFSSCEKDQGPLIIIPPQIPAPLVPVSFANDIQPIFNAMCVHCHNLGHCCLNLLPDSSWHQLLVTGASAPYVDTLYPTESFLYIRVAGVGQDPPAMPPVPPILLKSETDLILKWIQEGAKNN